MLDVMLDLETMGNGPDAAIVAIGAVEFDIDEGLIGRKFYMPVSLQSSVSLGGIIDPSTVEWWMEQSDEARSMFKVPGVHIAVALNEFSGWMGRRENCEDVRVWGNGAAFDNVILASAYRRADIPRPWLFWNDRCYRTVKALHPDVKIERVGTHHNAVDDAESQARHLIRMLTPVKK